MPKYIVVVTLFLSLLSPLESTAQTQASPATENNEPEHERSLTVTVKPNQSLSSIMIDYGLPASPGMIDAISRYNNLTSVSIVYPGDIISIPIKYLKKPHLSSKEQTNHQDSVCTFEVCFEETTPTSPLNATQTSQPPNKVDSKTSGALPTGETETEEVLSVETQHEQRNSPLTPAETVGQPESTQPQSTQPETIQQDKTHTTTQNSVSQPNAAYESVARSDLTGKVDNQLDKNKATESTQAVDSGAVVDPGAEVDTDAVEDPDAETASSNQSSESSSQLAPGMFEVDEDAAIRALETSLVKINALLLRSREAELSIDFSYAYDQSTGADLFEVTDEQDVVTTRVGEIEDTNTSLAATLSLAVGMPYDSQLSLQLPLVRNESESIAFIANSELDTVSASASGTGDFSISLAKTLLREKGRRPDVIARVTYDSDTGDTDPSGIQLGNNHESIALSVGATKRQDPLVFSYGISHSVQKAKDNFKPGAQTSFTASTLLAASPSTSLLFSFNYTAFNSAELNGETLRGTKGSDSTLNLGVSSVIGTSTFMSAGVVAGLTDSSNDYTAYLGISKRFRY